jgi:hypothetical protein
MVPPYFASVGKSSIEQKSSKASHASVTWAFTDVEAFHDRCRRHAVRHGSKRRGWHGKTAGAAGARASHSMIGKASNALVPAGFRMWVNGSPMLRPQDALVIEIDRGLDLNS